MFEDMQMIFMFKTLTHCRSLENIVALKNKIKKLKKNQKPPHNWIWIIGGYLGFSFIL